MHRSTSVHEKAYSEADLVIEPPPTPTSAPGGGIRDAFRTSSSGVLQNVWEPTIVWSSSFTRDKRQCGSEVWWEHGRGLREQIS